MTEPKTACLIAVKFHSDERGILVAFDQHSLPFVPVRTFIISDVPVDQSRAGHAVSCDEFLWLLSGSTIVDLDDGKIRKSFHLDARREGIFVPAGVRIDLKEFARETVLVVFASKTYSETVYFDRPTPELFAKRYKPDDSTSRS